MKDEHETTSMNKDEWRSYTDSVRREATLYRLARVVIVFLVIFGALVGAVYLGVNL